MKNMKKVFLMLIVFTLFFSTTLYASGYRIDEYKIEANVNTDGSMDVTEYLKYYFEESMNGVFRDILYKYTFDGQKSDMSPTSSRYQASDVTNIRAYTSNSSFNTMNEARLDSGASLSNGMSNVFSVSDITNNGYRKKLKVYSPVSSESYKFVKYEYVIEDVAVNYLDNAEIFWNFVGGDWECPINNLEVQISVPASQNVKVFGHTYGNLGLIDVSDNKITLTADYLSSGTALDARVVFPNTYMENVSKKVNSNYDFETLNNIEEEAKIGKENYHLSNKIWFVYAGINVFAFIYLIVKASKSANKNLKNLKNVEPYTDLPDTYSLGDYNCIKNRYFGYSDPHLIVATLLDLSNRKFIKLESIKEAKLFKDKYAYYVSVEKPEELTQLNTYEKELLNYIFNKKTGENIDIEDFRDNRFELNKRFEEMAYKYTLTSKFRKSCSDKTTEKNKEMYNPVPKSLWNSFGITMLIIALVAIINIFVISPLTDKFIMLLPVIFIGIFTFVILAVIIESTAKSLKDIYVDEYNKLIGLEKYLKEYSVIKDRYPIEIALWGKYLVFASLFGIADKVAKEFKEELLKQGYDEDYIFTTYPIIHMGIHSNSIVTSAGSATGSSSSGGYSGGGGGGGGRRWWRRRCLLRSLFEMTKNK